MDNTAPQRTGNETIMAVDDTPANLAILVELLGRRGYRVAAFPRGSMALKAAALEAPDLILLDIMMPGMDGFEICMRLKEDEKLREIPVLFISALDDPAGKVRAFAAGGVDYVTKPFQEEELAARVRTHLDLGRMRKELERHNHYLEDLVREKVREISESQLATILALSRLAESRDDVTGKHIERSRSYCRVLALCLREDPRFRETVTDEFVENIYHAAPLHDIGKVGIPDRILLKPGKLTPEEFRIMKTHTTIGSRTLERVLEEYPGNALVKMGITLTRYHHEKWDGTGYPEGLAGENIPLGGRIMALADVYDALRSNRPYKEAFSHERSVGIIIDGKGSHFDPVVVDAFLARAAEFAAI
ncbi:putative two-component system response regulator [Aminivibrio pyruvatiphilus]|uniref:Putative two-component system response regulator n=1 Tax=Aminivibrio pyruvatiphilus TaxID=1005740 RepID=A0A4V3HGY3_9BACT|nr:HD domain-containing phosphohydrolase [Aminivibrio pyruvatiphilus]TDY63131.1 putative two-component system response regulator [Aminivibrio pyruvatiphilus]